MANVTRVRFWDLAATPDGDWTAGVKMIRDPSGIYYVEHVERGRWTPMDRDAVILSTAAMDGRNVPIWVEQEPGSSGVTVVASLVRMLAGYAVHGERATGSKVSRAAPLAAQCEAGNVRLLRGPWNLAFLDELTTFPHGSHDDQVDAASGAFNKLALALVPERTSFGSNPAASWRGRARPPSR